MDHVAIRNLIRELTLINDQIVNARGRVEELEHRFQIMELDGREGM